MDWGLGANDRIDHFRVIRPLGRGSTAEVYLARDETLGRRVALKVIRPEVLGHDVERFLHEARATAKFNHPHIVTIYAVGESEGRPYLALEYVEGKSLRERLESDPPTVAESMRIGMAIAEALVEAHAAGVLHRDLKPENVIMARDGRPRVVDFGLAGVPTPEGATPGETSVQGTPGYMAPEQWNGKPTSGSTDVWALGVILFELLSGHRPVGEPSLVAQATRVCGSEPMPRVDGEVRADLADLIARCLDKYPPGRPPATDAANELRRMLALDRGTAASEESPFRGLMPFHEEHRHLFFGREAEIAACAERLREQPLLPILGASGAGKSSLVHAGLVPRLRERGPLVVLTMRPGNDPFRTLAMRVVVARKQTTGADAGPDTERLSQQLAASPMLLNLTLQRLAERRRATVLLFVDQLEELVTLVPDEETRQAFMQALCSAADDADLPVRVVLTLREEFLSRLAVAEDVHEAFGQVTVLRAPGPTALREIVSQPPTLVGYAYDDPGLPGRMVDEVACEASCLPLLEFAGSMLWQRRNTETHVLERAAYDAMGGVAGALAQHADGVLTGMSADDVALARSILLRLVTDEGTRRVLSRDQVLDGLAPGAATVLGKLTEARLLISAQADEGSSQVELVHESLVNTWGRLARWIDESSEELRFLTEIGQAAELWRKRGEHDEEAWEGQPLIEAERAIGRCTTEVPTLVRRFVEASRRKERRRLWRRRALSVAAFALLSAVAVVYMVKERETRGQRDVAITRQALALREGARAAHDRGDPLTARAMVRESLELEDSPLGRAVWWRLTEDPLVLEIPGGMSWPGISPDGRQLALNRDPGVVTLFDARTAEPQLTLQFPVRLTDIFYVNNDLIAAATIDYRHVIFSTQTGEVVRILEGERGNEEKTYDDIGQRVAIGWRDGHIEVQELRTGKSLGTIRRPPPKEESATGCVFVGDNHILAEGREPGQIVLWNITTGNVDRELFQIAPGFVLVPLRGHGHDRVALWGEALRLHDARTGRLEVELPIPFLGETPYYGLAMEPDHRHLVVADGPRIERWDIEARERVGYLGWTEGHGFLFNAIGDVDSRFVTGNQVFRADRLRPRTSRRALLNGAASNSISNNGPKLVGRDGARMAVEHADQMIRLWETRGPTLTRDLFYGKELGLGDISRDGTLVAVDDLSRLYQLETGDAVALEESARNVGRFWFIDDGRVAGFAVGPAGGRVHTWSASSGRLLRSAAWPPGYRPLQVARETVVFGRASGEVTILDLRTGRTRRRFDNLFNEFSNLGGPKRNAAVSEDGRFIGVFRHEALWLLDLETGAERELDYQRFGLSAEQARPNLAKFWITPGGKRAVVILIAAEQSFAVWDLDEGVVVAGPVRVPSSSGIGSFHADSGLLVFATIWGSPGVVRIYDTNDGRSIWRGPLLSRAGPRLLTHEGWLDLTSGELAETGPWEGMDAATTRLARESSDGRALCAWCWDDTVLWQRGERSFTAAATGILDLEPVAEGCVTRDRTGTVRLLRAGHEPATLVASGAHALFVAGTISVATDDRLLHFENNGEPASDAPFPGHGISAFAVIGKREVTATRDGRVAAERVVLRDTPTFPAVRMVAGPSGGLVVVAFEEGTVGLWDLDTGAALHTERVHGIPNHLLLKDQKLYVASDLGDHLVWDLSDFYLDHCTLLRSVWEEVEVVVQGGTVVVREPPANHPCLAKK